jgi:cold-inducible RNA-binding protein
MSHEESKLFVGGLPESATHAELVKLFATAGPVYGVKVVMDRKTGRSKGFAFVEMATPADAEAALKKLDGHKMVDRRIFVTPARPLEKRVEPAAPKPAPFVERRSGADRRVQPPAETRRAPGAPAPSAKAPPKPAGKPPVKPAVFGPGFSRDKWKKPGRTRR